MKGVLLSMVDVEAHWKVYSPMFPRAGMATSVMEIMRPWPPGRLYAWESVVIRGWVS